MRRFSRYKRKYGRKKRKSRSTPRRSKRSRRLNKLRLSKRKWVSPTDTERRRMMKRCGRRCFLEPDHLGFPICWQDCQISRAGIIAARKRAGEWRKKHPVAYKRAFELNPNKYLF